MDMAQRLNEIRERVEKVTPGPWKDDMLDIYDANGDIVAYDEGVLDGPNGDFITNSRQDIPLLLSYIERLDELVKHAKWLRHGTAEYQEEAVHRFDLAETALDTFIAQNETPATKENKENEDAKQ